MPTLEKPQAPCLLEVNLPELRIILCAKALPVSASATSTIVLQIRCQMQAFLPSEDKQLQRSPSQL